VTVYEDLLHSVTSDPEDDRARLAFAAHIKATDFLAISDAEFTAYVKEIDVKYPKGKKIRSNKFDKIDGQRLRGDPVLEVPAENLQPTDKSVTGDPGKMKELAARRARFEQIAADNGVELRYTAE
jgi:hypothetical protein